MHVCVTLETGSVIYGHAHTKLKDIDDLFHYMKNTDCRFIRIGETIVSCDHIVTVRALKEPDGEEQ